MFRKTVLVLAAVAATLAVILALAIASGVGVVNAPRASIPAVSSAGGEASAAPAREIAGEFTGSYLAGVPIYRLPPVNVVANRQVELARIEREEREALALARAQRKAEGARTDATVHTTATTGGSLQ
jgi:hypothetical protein